jgi:hypothetical protein
MNIGKNCTNQSKKIFLNHLKISVRRKKFKMYGYGYRYYRYPSVRRRVEVLYDDPEYKLK